MSKLDETGIDAIITWVDGYDPKHKEKRGEYLKKEYSSLSSESIHPTRFNQSGELTYCVRSILKYAPWIRTIYIVTDSQTPPIYEMLKHSEYQDKLKLIDHKDIFSGFEDCLPTFNSISIETMLWRIEDLSERFIYFNDDCFLTRPVTEQDFFIDDKPVIRGEWRTQTAYKWQQKLRKWLQLPFTPKIDSHRGLLERTARKVEYQKHYFYFPHAPFSLKKSTFAEYFSKYPDDLKNNIQYRFRDMHQFWPVALVQLLTLKYHQGILDDQLEAVMVNGAFHQLKKIKHRLDKVQPSKKIAFLCMQGIDSAPRNSQQYLLNWLEMHLGHLR